MVTTRRFTGIAPKCWSVSLVALTLAVLFPATVGHAIEDEEDRTIRAMVDAGLDRIAVDYIGARRRLADDLDTETKWVVRLSEFYAQSALRSADSGQWQRAVSVAEQFETAHPDNRRQPWLQWQISRTDFLHAQSELAAHLAAPSNARRRDTVLKLVRQVLRRIDDMDRDITARRQVAARQQGGNGSEASVKQLNQLQVDASLLLCEAVWLRTQLYPPGSKDRIAAATLLTDTARAVLTKTDATWPSRPQLEISNAAAQLQLSAAQEGLQTLRRLALAAPTEALRGTAAQLAIDYLCGKQSVSQARSLLGSIASGTPRAELAELQIALADLENKSAAARDSELKRIVNMASEIRLHHGEYWGNRADALLVGSGAADSASAATGTALDLLRVEVKQLIASGDVESAISKLQGRVELESSSGNERAALELASQTAALLHSQKESLQAARLLSKVAVDFAANDQAAKQHQLSLAYLQQALRSNATKELFAEYEDALRLQLATWPTSPDSVLPTQWLSVWLTGQKREEELLEVVWAKATAGSVDSAAGDLVRWLNVFAATSKQASTLRNAEAWPRSPVQDVERLQAGALAAAELLAIWPAPDQRSKLITAVAPLANVPNSADERSSEVFDALKAIHQSIVCLDATRTRDLAFAKREATKWKRESTPTNVLRSVGVGIVDAIDFTPLRQHATWAEAVGTGATWSGILLEARAARYKAAGLRMQGWISGPSASIEGLERLREKVPSDATVLLHLSRTLAESGESRLDHSTRLAKVVIKNTAATSNVHLFARWRWLANLKEAGKGAKAASEAEYFLAVSPPNDPVWKDRFEAFSR
ncbi:MAG: hypothetical protein Aurels2KO_05320 [Aureliella sp.]